MPRNNSRRSRSAHGPARLQPRFRQLDEGSGDKCNHPSSSCKITRPGQTAGFNDTLMRFEDEDAGGKRVETGLIDDHPRRGWGRYESHPLPQSSNNSLADGPNNLHKVRGGNSEHILAHATFQHTGQQDTMKRRHESSAEVRPAKAMKKCYDFRQATGSLMRHGIKETVEQGCDEKQRQGIVCDGDDADRVEQTRQRDTEENGNPAILPTRPQLIDPSESQDPSPPPFCDLCKQDGTHSTGRCALVTSVKHGDTKTDPFCDCSTYQGKRDRYGNKTHSLQRRRHSSAPTVHVYCIELATHWQQGHLGLLFEKFVVERRRMAPLQVQTRDFCFIRLALAYSSIFCRGEMPEALEGIWPYTKADARRFTNQLQNFYTIGIDNMPRGELEGQTMSQIRDIYDTDGGIPPQCRWE